MRRISILTVIAFSALCTDVSRSQGVSVGRDGVKLMGFGDVDVPKTLENWEERTRRHITSRINLQIELLETVCELEQPDIDKLRLAAQGVAARRLAAGRKQLELFIYDSGLAPRQQAEEDTPPRTSNDRLIATGAGKTANGVVEFKTAFEQPLMEHPLWLKMLQASLNSDQHQKYQDYCRGRNLKYLSTAITLAIADLNTAVFLSETQSQAIFNHTLERLGPGVDTLRPASIEQARTMTNPIFKESENFREFLRPSQMKRLEDLKADTPKTQVGWSAPRN